MAQIVTITNPLTGQPAQVDQLDHTAQEIDDAIARALPGGAIDITLQNKAPAGYGLGTTAKLLTSDDNLDGIRANGFYGWASSLPTNAPSMYMSMRVENDSYTGHVVQTLTGWNDSSNSQMRRIRTDSGWQQWEYVNPPMALGVEYRTTERYLGKPVYTMCIDCGMSENGKIIRVTPENGLATLIRGYVVQGGEPAFYIVGDDFSNSYSRYANVEQDGGQIKIDLHQGSSVASKQTYAIVYYTKE